jgi:hypothetical protein
LPLIMNASTITQFIFLSKTKTTVLRLLNTTNDDNLYKVRSYSKFALIHLDIHQSYKKLKISKICE